MNQKYDLEERTVLFGERVIKLTKEIPINTITRQIIAQLVRCATSIGANYCEADNAESRKDFKHKIGICKKESRETRHFIRMLAVAVPEYKNELRILWLEAKELNLIFNAIFHSMSKSKN